MKWLIVPPNKRQELSTLNDASPFKKLIPKTGTKNNGLIPVSVLQDCGQDQTWGAFGTFLTGLEIVEDSIPVHKSVDISLAVEKDRAERQAICDVCPFYNTKCTLVSKSCPNCGKAKNKFGTCPKNYW